MNCVVPEYDFIQNLNSIWSVGSHSAEWIENTFGDDKEGELSETAYITGNLHSELVSDSDLNYFEDANNYDFSPSNSPVPPANVITDRAIRYARNEDWDRLIVHYMQPHKPFFDRHRPREDPEIIGDWTLGKEMYHQLVKGYLSTEELHEAFVDNLRYVLDDVSILLNNLDAETVVLTSDHGQAIGENFLYDHHRGIQHEETRLVPWIETTAVDKQTIEPESFDTKEYDRGDRLEALGYI